MGERGDLRAFFRSLGKGLATFDRADAVVVFVVAILTLAVLVVVDFGNR